MCWGRVREPKPMYLLSGAYNPHTLQQNKRRGEGDDRAATQKIAPRKDCLGGDSTTEAAGSRAQGKFSELQLCPFKARDCSTFSSITNLVSAGKKQFQPQGQRESGRSASHIRVCSPSAWPRRVPSVGASNHRRVPGWEAQPAQRTAARTEGRARGTSQRQHGFRTFFFFFN